MVLANWDHHYDLDKEVSVLTIPKDYLLLLVFTIVIVSVSLSLALTASNRAYASQLLNFFLPLLSLKPKKLKINIKPSLLVNYRFLIMVS
jgi:hypothetical protein